jgi:Cu/Zn superoxide dismutase
MRTTSWWVPGVLTVVCVVGACKSSNTGPQNQAETYTAVLTGAKEQPAVQTSATGNGTVTLSADRNTITYTVTFTGLTSNAIAAHIHGPFDPAAQTGGAPVILPFANVPSSTSGTITGSANRQSVLQNNVSFDSLVALLRNGKAYVNVHSVNYKPGEIRDQLQKSP